LPKGHTSQVEAPMELWNLPVEHKPQLVEPFTAVKEPAAHKAQPL
jgi:hypothetical protein